MARPRKHRNVCGLPETDRFGPLGVGAYNREVINMTIDQYETIRLIDLEGLNQAECADQMHIARTTVQRIYSDARKIIAEVLVKGKILKIQGGDYKLCDGTGEFCEIGHCQGNRKGRGKNRRSFKNKEGEMVAVKIAIPVNEKSMETEVYESFGRAPYFLIYNLDTKESNFIENAAAQARGGAGIIAAQTIVDSKADVLLTPRLGKNAADVVVAAEIKMYKSVDGLVKKNIELYEAEELKLLDEIHSGFHNNGEK